MKIAKTILAIILLFLAFYIAFTILAWLLEVGLKFLAILLIIFIAFMALCA